MIQLTVVKKFVSIKPFITYNNNSLNDYQLIINRCHSTNENVVDVFTEMDAIKKANTFWNHIKNDSQKIILIKEWTTIQEYIICKKIWFKCYLKINKVLTH